MVFIKIKNHKSTRIIYRENFRFQNAPRKTGQKLQFQPED